MAENKPMLAPSWRIERDSLGLVVTPLRLRAMLERNGWVQRPPTPGIVRWTFPKDDTPYFKASLSVVGSTAPNPNGQILILGVGMKTPVVLAPFDVPNFLLDHDWLPVDILGVDPQVAMSGAIDWTREVEGLAEQIDRLHQELEVYRAFEEYNLEVMDAQKAALSALVREVERVLRPTITLPALTAAKELLRGRPKAPP